MQPCSSQVFYRFFCPWEVLQEVWASVQSWYTVICYLLDQVGWDAQKEYGKGVDDSFQFSFRRVTNQNSILHISTEIEWSVCMTSFYI